MFVTDNSLVGRISKYGIFLLMIVLFLSLVGCNTTSNQGDGTGNLTVIYDYSYFASDIPEEVFFADEVETGNVNILQEDTVVNKDLNVSAYSAETTFYNLNPGMWDITGTLIAADQEILFQEISEYEVKADEDDTHTVKVEPEWSVTVVSGTNVAAGGEVTIHVRASVNNRYYTGVRVTWKLRDPDGNFNKGGSWETCTEKTIGIPSDARTGEWEIDIYYGDEKVTSATINVQ